MKNKINSIFKMKRIHQISGLLLVFILFTSCNYLQPNKEENLSLEKDFKTVKIKGKYQMSIPNYMKQTNQLNDEASLQYNNLFKETYVIVIDESKEQFVSAINEAGINEFSQSTIESYRDIQMQLLRENINISNEKISEKKTFNGMNSEQVAFVGKISGVDDEISYILTFIEGENDLYMIMGWTLNKYSKKYTNTFLQIADSFKEL
ncbi:hypothetical protein A7A78_01095 [Aequorivita soesokkakensis]|uniref:PsbP C-terminal domain-containing protein n=2 Tax=Aequorivita soesokkakensis TaxID=1385699 RepID=A0A1A9LI08_9FLAO|nr:hypothetical protein A7A78_01095 [Aequorivita soesokkakensis]